MSSDFDRFATVDRLYPVLLKRIPDRQISRRRREDSRRTFGLWIDITEDLVVLRTMLFFLCVAVYDREIPGFLLSLPFTYIFTGSTGQGDRGRYARQCPTLNKSID